MHRDCTAFFEMSPSLQRAHIQNTILTASSGLGTAPPIGIRNEVLTFCLFLKLNITMAYIALDGFCTLAENQMHIHIMHGLKP